MTQEPEILKPRPRWTLALMLSALFAALFCAAATAAPIPRLKPPAPAPSAYVTPQDYTRLKDVRQALVERKWAIARAIAWSVEDPVARGLGLLLDEIKRYAACRIRTRRVSAVVQ
ncbi:MAG: hypothetical protein AAGL49_00730, partial [Pseudomonadota bacterium]